MKLISIFTLLLGMIIFFSNCSKQSVTPKPTKVGDAYQGGIVFSIDNTGNHGLISSATDQGFSVTWWNGNFVSTGATSLTNGSSNTTSIITTQGNTNTYAAKLCKDFRGGGYSDWYLPSKSELDLLYHAKDNVGGFSTNLYWSSTEFDLGDCWVEDFGTGTQNIDNESDGANVAVRAIRAY